MSLHYLKTINPSFEHPLIDEMKAYASDNHVPIITDEGIHLIIQLLNIHKAKKVLEIGTAIGYSAILMSFFTGVDVWSIERNHVMYQKAKENIEKMALNDKIHLLLGDAKEIDIQDKDFDLIFIDAAKSAYIDFFNRYKDHVKKGGLIITDNLLFRGQVAHPDQIDSRNRKQLVKKIDRFNQYIISQNDFDTYIYGIGDGLSISIKK